MSREKKSNVTASITKKGKSYYAVISIPQTDGTRKSKWVKYTGVLTSKGEIGKSDKMAFLNEQIEKYKTQNVQNENIKRCDYSTDMPFSDFIDFWYKNLPSESDIITLQGYKSVVDVHLKPYFDSRNLTISTISQKDIQEFIDWERWHGNRRKNYGELSANTVNKILKMIRAILRCGESRGLTTISPNVSIDHPKVKKYQATVLNSKQINILLDYLIGDDFYPLVYFAVVYGLRRSELLGLQWHSVDYAKNSITIADTVVKGTGAPVLKNNSTKSKSSHRTMQLTPEGVQILRNLQKNEKYWSSTLKNTYVINDYVFKKNDGNLYHPDYVTKHFEQLVVDAGLPKIRLHDLRHSCATYLYNELHFSLDDVSNWLGHSDVSITKSIYIYSGDERSPEITKKFAENFKNRTAQNSLVDA